MTQKPRISPQNPGRGGERNSRISAASLAGEEKGNLGKTRKFWGKKEILGFGEKRKFGIWGKFGENRVNSGIEFFFLFLSPKTRSFTPKLGSFLSQNENFYPKMRRFYPKLRRFDPKSGVLLNIGGFNPNQGVLPQNKDFFFFTLNQGGFTPKIRIFF